LRAVVQIALESPAGLIGRSDESRRDASISGPSGPGGCIMPREYLEITPPASFMSRIVALSGSARK